MSLELTFKCFVNLQAGKGITTSRNMSKGDCLLCVPSPTTQANSQHDASVHEFARSSVHFNRLIETKRNFVLESWQFQCTYGAHYFPSVLLFSFFLLIIGTAVDVIFTKMVAANFWFSGKDVDRRWENSNRRLPHLKVTIWSGCLDVS